MLFGDAVRTIKERLSIVELAGRYLHLRQNGNRFVAPCPFHQETKPSFSINEEKGLFYCFGCQAAGDIIDFYARINGLEFRESVLQLAEQAGIVIDGSGISENGQKLAKVRSEKQQMLAMHKDAAAHFAASLAKSDECREYIAKRGLNSEIIERFGLGWAGREWHDLEHFLIKRKYDPNIAIKCGLLGKSRTGAPYDRFRGRLMFPIRDLSSQIIAFGGRIIADEEEAKYINSSDTPIYSKKEHLFGLPQARREISAKGRLLLTEGYMDVLTLHQFGYGNGVGALGTAFTDEQAHRISGFTSNVGLLFDGDKPGRKAALRAASLLLAKGLHCTVILLPDGEDIDSLLRGVGPAAFDKLCENAPDGLTFCISVISQWAPREAATWTKEFLAKIDVPELVGKYATLIAQKLGFEENIIRKSLPAQRSYVPKCEDNTEICSRDAQILIFAVRYPERLDDLRELGADLALTRPNSRMYWKLLETYDPEEVVYYLNDAQKRFWLENRGPLAPPRVNGDLELACLKTYLEKFYAKSQASALHAALAKCNGNNFQADLEYLQAIKNAMRVEDEQS